LYGQYRVEKVSQAEKKAGFKDWERKLKGSGGRSVNLSSQLEKLPGQ